MRTRSGVRDNKTLFDSNKKLSYKSLANFRGGRMSASRAATKRNVSNRSPSGFGSNQNLSDNNKKLSYKPLASFGSHQNERCDIAKSLKRNPKRHRKQQKLV